MNLGTKPHDYSKAIEPSKPKTSYPSITLSDAIADAFKKETGGCEIGETYVADVKLKVSALRDDQYGKSITLDVISMDVDYDEPEPPRKGSKYKNPAVGAALKK